MDRTSISSMLLLAVCCSALPVHADSSCSALSRNLHIPHATITLVAEVPAGAFRPADAGGAPGGPPANFTALPAFCRVAGTLRPTPDSDIRFEVWMPLAGWNGKFVGGGNGVWAMQRPPPMWVTRAAPWTGHFLPAIRRS
jgi:feruloyl esterase